MYTPTFVCNELSSSCDLFSNDSFEGEPEEKRRKTTNVVIDQPATEPKVLIDNVPDQSSLLDEVSRVGFVLILICFIIIIVSVLNV